ncbi:MAG: ImmA/IrrE family metallo-endopeptidase [Bacteroidetes bacterium]|nr:ImmA/IrrE family metallo-endopeptidase [Bacteroidota bacterium]
MINRVTIRPELFQWACKRGQVDPDKLEKRFPKYTEWEKGFSKPTHKQLEHFAKFTHVPIWTLFLKEPPVEEMPIRDLRTMDNQDVQQPTSNLLDTIYLCLQRQDWYRSFSLEEREQPLPFVGSATINSDVQSVADDMRSVLHFNETDRNKLPDWSCGLQYLSNQAESIGMLVMISSIVGNNTHRKLKVEEFRGFSLADPIAPLIFINGVGSIAEQIFTLSHELAHIWLGQSVLSKASMDSFPDHHTEQWCHQVVAELLFPKKSMIENFQKNFSIDENLRILTRHYKVSTIVILQRLKDLEILQPDEFMEYYRIEMQRSYPKPYGCSRSSFNSALKNRVSHQFGSALVASTFSGDTSFTDTFHYLGIRKTSTLKSFAKSFNMRVD